MTALGRDDHAKPHRQLRWRSALLVTVVIAGLGFRCYVRGKQLNEQTEIARELQPNLLPD